MDFEVAEETVGAEAREVGWVFVLAKEGAVYRWMVEGSLHGNA